MQLIADAADLVVHMLNGLFRAFHGPLEIEFVAENGVIKLLRFGHLRIDLDPDLIVLDELAAAMSHSGAHARYH